MMSQHRPGEATPWDPSLSAVEAHGLTSVSFRQAMKPHVAVHTTGVSVGQDLGEASTYSWVPGVKARVSDYQAQLAAMASSTEQDNMALQQCPQPKQVSRWSGRGHPGFVDAGPLHWYALLPLTLVVLQVGAGASW